MPYAERTDVPVSRSKGEIEATITRYGATKYQSGWDNARALVAFEAQGRRVRFVLPLPAPENFASQRAFEQESRRVWRALALVIKAKLESYASGIETFDEAFAAQILLPNNMTVGEWLAPQLDAAYRTDDMPPMLPLPSTPFPQLPSAR